MRKIATLDDLNQAETCRWYLESQGINVQHELEEDSLGDIWIFDDDEVPRAKAMLADFQRDPNSSKALDLASQAKNQYAKAKLKAAKEQRKQEKRQARNLPFPVTTSVAFISICVFIINHWIFKNSLDLVLRFSMWPPDYQFNQKTFHNILSGQIWRLVTPIFLHGDILHIGLNLLCLVQLGRPTEECLGTKKFLTLIVCVAIPSHIAFYLVAGPAFGGLSGVISGAVGFLWYMERFGHQRVAFDPNLINFFTILYVVFLALSAFGFGIANTIHGVGGLMGIVFGYFFNHKLSTIKAKGMHLLKHPKPLSKDTNIIILLLIAGMIVDHLKHR